MKFSRIGMVAWLAVASLAIAGCGEAGTECGPGTVAQDGTCVPEITGCAPGTTLVGDQCVPECATSEYWDATAQACVDVPECASGTTFNPVSGMCEPSEELCGEGTHLENGVCVPDTSGCGEGTHLDNGECVPDVLPDPDVVESSDPENPATFDLPEDGESVSLGGVVDTPVDDNNDGYLDADWDAFAFTAPAGTYLRIHATSEEATLPAFMVVSTELDGDGYPLFARYAINPNGVDTIREVYLPRSDVYLVFLTDYNHMLNYLFGTAPFPVGGDEFGYYATVENLGTPVISDVSSLPLDDSGELTDGGLYFYDLKDLTARGVVSLTSAGEPLPDTPSDVLPLITLFDHAGEPFLEATGNNPAADAQIVFAVPADGDYLLVQDFLVAIGPNRHYALRGVEETVNDCTQGGCGDGALAEGEHRVLRWDLAAGDFFLFNFTVPSDATENLAVELFDSQMNSVSRASAGPTWNRWMRMFAESDDWVYLWVEGWTGGAVPSYSLEYVHEATLQLENGMTHTGLPVLDMPDETMPDAGVDHLLADAGQVVVSAAFSTPGWTDPVQEFHSTGFSIMGPAVDTTGAELARLNPSLAFLPENDTYLHLAYDAEEGSDIVGDTYDAGLALLDSRDLGEFVGDPLSLDNQTLDATLGMAVYTYQAVASEQIEIVVTPSASTTIQPEIWVMGFGFQSGANWYWNENQPTLGLKDSATATGPGNAVNAGHLTDYAGLHLVIVRDAGSGDPADTFAIEITEGT